MDSQNGYYPYYNQNQYNNGYNRYNNINYNYYQDQNNNNYKYNQNGNINQYYNNNPVYPIIPPSNSYQNENENKLSIENKNEEKEKKPKLKRGIVLNFKKENMCFLRGPEYQPGYINQTYGKPQFIQNQT